jgi:hypothetical protein
MKSARRSPVTTIATAIHQSARRLSASTTRWSASPVRKAMTTAAAWEAIARTTETMSDHL